MVPNNSFVNGFLHKHAQFPKGAVLERFLCIKLDVLDTAISTSPNLGVVHKILVYHFYELLPLS